MAAGLDYRLLGPVDVRAEGVAVDIGGPRQRALLALLLLEPGRPLPPAQLADELWQGQPPPSAEATLRSSVSRLRRALGSDVLPAAGSGYAAVVPPEAVDLHRFERLAREGRDALARGAAGIAAERLSAGLGLWRGRALADVATGGRLAAAARRLDELRLVCLEDRLEADLALGRHVALVPELRALVEQEPLRERLRRLLVLALYRSEQQAEALAAYREARRTLDEELGLEPGPELQALERAILRHEVEDVAPAEARHNLPLGTSSFVGRETDLDRLERLLRRQRLVTVTGLGGTGKTRLALELAGRQLDAWTDGVWLVDLTALADPALVVPAVGAVLGVEDATTEALVAHARSLEALLLLDNCEHLAPACAELVEALLRAAPHLRVLATSRSSLGTPGEVDFALAPLEAEAAVTLFLDRAAAVRRDLPRDAQSLATVAAICRELDGLPLAIELAAARANALSAAEIAAHLDDRFRFLRAWHRVADPRHRTLETTMDWSYGLLDDDERALLRRLAVFAGGAQLDAVVEVCAVGEGPAAVDLLARLVDASLVQAEGGERTRYRLLETVRQYAAAKLADDPDADAVRRRHAEHYLRLADAANLSIEKTGRGPQNHEPVLREQHNLRAAIDWATGADVELGLRLMVALENFWIAQALAEGAQRYGTLLARADGVDRRLLALALCDHASCLDVSADFAAAKPIYERSRELFAELGDEHGVAYLDYRIAIVIRLHEGDYARARELVGRSLETFRRLGDQVGELQVLGVLGHIELDHGDAEWGRELARRSIAMAHEIGWHWWETRYQGLLALDALAHDRLDEAEEHGRVVVRLGWETGNGQDVVYGLALLARAAAARGDAGRALALWATVEATEDRPGRMGRFDRAGFAAAMPAGPRPEPLPAPAAVALALGD